MATMTGLNSNLKANRTSILLKDAVGTKSNNRRIDVVTMAEKVNLLKANLKLLVTVLKGEQAALLKLNAARLEVGKVIAGLSVNSPIEDCCGTYPPDSDTTGKSFASIRASHVVKNKLMCERYSQFIVKYAEEWETVISTRTSNDLKKNDQLRRELDHYEVKVVSLRTSANVTMAKGKVVNPKLTEQLNRNESKLTESRMEYDKFATNLSSMLDEVTTSCWKDLHPLMVKMSQFDITCAKDQSTCFAQLNDVLENLKSISAQNGLKPEARLKDLATKDLGLLGAPSLRNAIENGPRSDPFMGGGGGQSFHSSSNLADHDPLSSDMGSLAISNDPFLPPSDFTTSYTSAQNALPPSDDFTSSSNSSFFPAPPPPPADLLFLNDAPPAPTMDMLNEATSAPPYAPPPNPPITHSSIFDMPSSAPSSSTSQRRGSSNSIQTAPQNYSQMNAFDAPPGPDPRRDSAPSQMANNSAMAPYQQQQQPQQQNQHMNSFNPQVPAPSYNYGQTQPSWQQQNQPPKAPNPNSSWQQNQSNSVPNQSPYQNQPSTVPNPSSYQPTPPNNATNQQSWQQNQSINTALTVSANQPSNQWASNSHPPPQHQQKPPYSQQYAPPGGPPVPPTQQPPPGPPGGQWNMASFNQQGNNMPPGPPPNMSQIPSGSYHSQNRNNPF